MNLSEIRRAQQTEREKSGLQALDDEFYQEAAQYIDDLKAQRERAADQADDPFSSPEVQRLTDEIETATETVESIYERRMGKVVKQASFSAAGMAADTECLTTEEQRLFEDLVDRLEQNRNSVLDLVQNNTSNPFATDDSDEPADSPEEPADATDQPDTSDDGGMDLSAAMGGGGVSTTESTNSKPADTADSDETTEQTAPADDVERTEVQIMEDVGSIFGVDEREYDLQSGDVVTLPTANAEPLLEKGAAEELGTPDETDNYQSESERQEHAPIAD